MSSTLKYDNKYFYQTKQEIVRFRSMVGNYYDDLKESLKDLANLCSNNSPKIVSDSFFVDSEDKIRDSIDYLDDIAKRLGDIVDYEHDIVEKYNQGIQNGEVDDFTKSLMFDVIGTAFINPDDFDSAIKEYLASDHKDDWMTWLKDYIAGGFITSGVIDMDAYLEAIKKSGAKESTHWRNFLIEGEESGEGEEGDDEDDKEEKEEEIDPTPTHTWGTRRRIEPSPDPQPTPEPNPQPTPSPTGEADVTLTATATYTVPTMTSMPRPTPSPTPDPTGHGPDPQPTPSIEPVPSPTDGGPNPGPGPEPEPTHRGGGYSDDGADIIPGDEVAVPDSIEDVVDGAKSYTKIPRQIKIDGKNTKTSGGSVIPIIAGLTSVGAAGLGAKAYLDHKNDEEEEDEEFSDEYSDDSTSTNESDSSNDEWFNDDFS